MEKHFKPTQPQQQNMKVSKGARSDIRENKHGRPPQVKNHNQNHYRRHHSDDDDSYDTRSTYSTTEDSVFNDPPQDNRRHRQKCSKQNHHSLSTTSTSITSSSSPSSSSSSSTSSSSSSFSSSSSSSSSSDSSSDSDSESSSPRSRPQHSRSCTDISRKTRYFDENDDTTPLLEGGESLDRNKKQVPQSGSSQSKHRIGRDGSVRKAKSMEALARPKQKTEKEHEAEQERETNEVRKNIVKEKIKFSAFLNEITRQVLSPMRLTTLGVTNVQRPTSPGQTSSRSTKSVNSTAKQEQQKHFQGSADSVSSGKRSHGSSKHSHSRQRHYSHRTEGSPERKTRRSFKRRHSWSYRQRSRSPSGKHHHYHHHQHQHGSPSYEKDHHPHRHHHSPTYYHDDHHKTNHYQKHHHYDDHHHTKSHHYKDYSAPEHGYNGGNHKLHHSDQSKESSTSPHPHRHHNDTDDHDKRHRHGDHYSPDHHHDERDPHHASQRRHRHHSGHRHHHGHREPSHQTDRYHGAHQREQCCQGRHCDQHLYHQSESNYHHSHKDHHEPQPHHHHGDHHYDSHYHQEDHHSRPSYQHGDNHSDTHNYHTDHHNDHNHHHGDHHSKHHQHHGNHHESHHHYGDHHKEPRHHHGIHHESHHHHRDHHNESHPHHENHHDTHHHHGDHYNEPHNHHGDHDNESHPHHGNHHESHPHHRDHHNEHNHHHGDHHNEPHNHHGDHYNESHPHHGNHHESHHHHGDHHNEPHYHHGDNHNEHHQHEEHHNEPHHHHGHHSNENHHHHGNHYESHHHHEDHHSEPHHHGDHQQEHNVLHQKHPEGSSKSNFGPRSPQVQSKSNQSYAEPERHGKPIDKSLESVGESARPVSASSGDEEQTSFISPLRKESTDGMGRIIIVQEQNEGLQQSLLKTAVRVECLGEEFISSRHCLEAELQRTRLELTNLTERFKRLHDNCSSTQQTNNLLEHKLHLVAQSMEGERQRLNQRISALMEQLANAKFGVDTSSVPHRVDSRGDTVIPITPPPAQFMDDFNFGKDKATGQEQSLGSVPEEEESDWSEIGDETPRFVLTGLNRGQVWRRRQSDADKANETGSEGVFRPHSPRPPTVPHLQLTAHNEIHPFAPNDLSDIVTCESPYKFTTSPSLGSAALFRSASLEDIPLTRHSTHKELQGTEAMMDLHHSGAEGGHGIDDEIIHHLRSSRDTEMDIAMSNLQSAERILNHLISETQHSEGKGEAQGWCEEIPDELLKGERTKL